MPEQNKYLSSFAIVTIESVWPSPVGNELAPDDYDVELLGVQNDKTNEDFKTSAATKFDRSRIFGGEDYAGENSLVREDVQGYYKIVPLNVLSASTQGSTGGNGFSVTFTLDDLLLITDENSGNLFSYATGLPFTDDDIFDSKYDTLPTIENINSGEVQWKYVKDDELGLARYRISGANASFNVEDLVSSNDTVTIWIYNDPQEFYSKDGAPPDVINSENDLSQDIKGIIGSGDRKNQFTVSNQTFTETLLTDSGLTNQIVSRVLEEQVLGTNIIDGNNFVTVDNYVDVLKNFGDAAIGQAELEIKNTNINTEELTNLSGDRQLTTTEITAMRYVYDFMTQVDGFQYSPIDEESAEIYGVNVVAKGGIDVYSDLIHHYIGVDKVESLRNNADDSLNETQGGVRDRLNVRLNFIKGVGLLNDGVNFVIPENTAQLKVHWDIAGVPENEYEDVLMALKNFISTMNKHANKYVKEQRDKLTIEVDRRVEANGRVGLITEAHGETPYSVMRGVISSVSVKEGAANGSFTVTVSGTGYEKVLNTNTIYVDSYVANETLYTVAADFHSVYSRMTPPDAMVDIVNRWAARRVLLGKDTSVSKMFSLRFSNTATTLAEDEPKTDEQAEEEEASELITSDIRVLNNPFGEKDKVIIRGNIIFSDFGPTEDEVRVYAPVNYLDTTRLREMSNATQLAYDNPEQDAILATAYGIEANASIMSNLQKLGGSSEFYELFVDATGRLRYRLGMEAYERTPDPLYTPTITDEDIMKSGATFSSDDSRIATLVDIDIPGSTSTSNEILKLGRSVPPPGKTPLTSSGLDPRQVSPSLFRHGLRVMKVTDNYTNEQEGAKRKALLYRKFYEKPVKKATIPLNRVDPAYKAGDTVLVCMQKSRKRSRTMFSPQNMQNWMTHLHSEKEVREMTIGVDERLANKDTYTLTSGEFLPIPSETLYQEYVEDAKKHVAVWYHNTFKWLNEEVGVGVLTPDYWPTTLWFYLEDVNGSVYRSWDEVTINHSVIIEFHKQLLLASIGNNRAAQDEVRNMLDEIPQLIDTVQFQNFRAQSFYIQNVNHTFVHGQSSTTSLSLNHGQDNLVLLEPRKLLPIGHLSIEKNMAIYYFDTNGEGVFERRTNAEGTINKRLGGANDPQALFWIDASTMSPLQKLYLEQFKQESQFRKASFAYLSQSYRNSSNYMHSLAQKYQLDTNVEIRIDESPSGGKGPVARNIGTSLETEGFEQFYTRSEYLTQLNIYQANALKANGEDVDFDDRLIAMTEEFDALYFSGKIKSEAQLLGIYTKYFDIGER